MKVELGHLTLGQWDIRHQMETKFEHVGRKFDRVDRGIKGLGNQLGAKIDRPLYFYYQRSCWSCRENTLRPSRPEE